MKVLLHYPKWGNRWTQYFEKELSRYDLTVTHANNGNDLGPLTEKADLLISLWFDEATCWWSHYFPEKKIISYLRRFEMWEPTLIDNMNYPGIDAVVFVSDYYRQVFKETVCSKPEAEHLNLFTIPNGVDVESIPFREKPAGTKKIAMVAAVKDVKNFPLAMQILLKLPEEYTIHQIGLSVEKKPMYQLLSYRESLGLQKRFIFPGHVPPGKVFDWLMDKDFILSTSINEGNPMNVLEAMAVGIKPVVHAWPGSKGQFDVTFKTIDSAAGRILDSDYDPRFYRNAVEREYSLSNYSKIHEVIEEVM